MKIHAETLVVRSPLRLPQTAVTIYARELRFEGTEAKIDTTPRSLTTRPAQFANGVDGLKAGDVSVSVEEFVSEPPAQTRFVLNGGKGQPGGFGQNGTTPDPMPTCGTWYGCPWPGNTTTAIYEWYDHDGDYQHDEWRFYLWSTDGWKPADGGNATPGGRPGNGGAGGSIMASLALGDYASFVGGQAGPGTNANGGAGGQPRPAYRANRFSGDWYLNAIYYSRDGADAFSPPPLIAVGASGTWTPLGHAVAWLSPYALRMVIAHAKDAYLYGHSEAADKVLAEYRVRGRSVSRLARLATIGRVVAASVLGDAIGNPVPPSSHS